MGGSSSKPAAPSGTREIIPGVVKEIVTPGDGVTRPRSGQAVRVHYTGTLENGSVFDSSVKRGEPFDFRVDSGMVIKCWDKGVLDMTLGEKAKLTCSPETAYGDNGIGPIPPKSTLNFEVELIKLF
eukprot:TRINITY_DN34368_c0_g1_i1.p1 TRINITY_DN34368_c0_g1~~TRINITY_DN34368_c0_g1_i1.p1  ORF type:complete len:126 (+),score=15.61 TRINITY_DN34368_c0_g1_i1:39-416(+)